MTGATFLYDGDCAFCSSCARFLQRRVATTARVVAWQRADLGRLGVTAEECDHAVRWVADERRHSSGPEAIADLLRTGRSWGRPFGWLLGRSVVLRLAWPVYAWVSDHRDRMPGGTATCALPAAERGEQGPH
ncbi:MAG: thiol-disulfide oxidoreductase DCC family protein [Nocardioidaceae bacterium]